MTVEGFAADNFWLSLHCPLVAIKIIIEWRGIFPVFILVTWKETVFRRATTTEREERSANLGRVFLGPVDKPQGAFSGVFHAGEELYEVLGLVFAFVLDQGDVNRRAFGVQILPRHAPRLFDHSWRGYFCE